MKNLFLRITIIFVCIVVSQIGKAQNFSITSTNTQVCLGTVTAQAYDVFNTPIGTPYTVPTGSGGAGCTTGVVNPPAYVIFTDGACSITVNVNTTYSCPAANPCTCTCIAGGKTFQVVLTTGAGGCAPISYQLTLILS